METVLLRVTKRLSLPHVVNIKGVGKVSFSPDAEVPKEWADNVLKSDPDKFVLADGKPNLKEYAFKESFKTETVADKVAKLSDADKSKVMSFIEKLMEKNASQADDEQKAKEDEIEKAVREKKEQEKVARKAAEEDAKVKAKQEAERIAKAEAETKAAEKATKEKQK